MSHITGGGFYENVPRSIPEGCSAKISKNSFPVPEIFKFLQETGGIPERDMYNTFNMGIGMTCIVARENAVEAVKILDEGGIRAYCIGEIVKGGEGIEIV